MSLIRLLRDPPVDGPTNMARDEAMLIHVGNGVSPPTLRLYQWANATISLGYFQRYADYKTLASPLRELAVVRRLTGGGAILHDQELTYSLVVPAGHAFLSRGPNCLYEHVHEAVIASLAELGLSATRFAEQDESARREGPFFCFARRHRYDLVIESGKVAGSAQRRTRQAVLQHGSIILADRYGQPGVAVVPVPFDDAVQVLSRLLPIRLARDFALAVVERDWVADELATADALIQKYAAAEWTRRM